MFFVLTAGDRFVAPGTNVNCLKFCDRIEDARAFDEFSIHEMYSLLECYQLNKLAIGEELPQPTLSGYLQYRDLSRKD